MKKYASLLLAAATMAVASCGSNQSANTQAQIDSLAAARADSMAAAMKVQNDSTINAMAKMKADSTMRADSIANAMAKATTKPVTTNHTAKKTTSTKPKTETDKVNDLFNKNKTDKQKSEEAKKEENKVNNLFK